MTAGRALGAPQLAPWVLLVRVLLPGALLMGGWGCAGSPTAPAILLVPGGSTVRVLLLDEPGPIAIEDAAAGAVTIWKAGDGLRVNGGPIVASWGAASSGTSGSVVVEGLRVRGAVEVHPTPGGVAVVNELPLEGYVAGTLGREMHAGWSAEALRAQAVATRTYAIHQRSLRGDQPYDLRAGTASQVYGGVAAESPSVRDAVAATQGQILAYRGRPILAAFHSASGGRTASAREVWGEPRDYLISLPVDGEDDSPDTYWRASISRTTLARAVAALGTPVGDVVRVKITQHSPSGRVQAVRVRGTAATATLTGRSLRAALGESVLKSTLFQLREEGDRIVFMGTGSGHGVGMSQWGARAMAERGAGYREILSAFYPGTQLVRLRESDAQVGARSWRESDAQVGARP